MSHGVFGDRFHARGFDLAARRDNPSVFNGRFALVGSQRQNLNLNANRAAGRRNAAAATAHILLIWPDGTPRPIRRGNRIDHDLDDEARLRGSAAAVRLRRPRVVS